MDSYTSRAILPALLGIIGAILSGCLGGVLGYALPIHTQWLRRRIGRHGEGPRWRSDRVLRDRLYARQGYGRVELRPGANLRAVDLAGRNLEAVNLRSANIEGANLQEAILQRANLAGAELSGSNLWGANLLGADLRRADLRYANLRDADLGGANLLHANLRGANLFRANLRGANLEGADLSGTHLFEADLTWTKTDVRTAMPQGWEDVVAHGPETRATAASTVREKVSEEEWLRTEKDAPEPQLIT